ncbi:ROK family protein [Anaeromyxobacter diazotrophicus]|uniref:Glucokinase n=1 Tax=Anaeromyxobacter diazotrophicus TaxID=2590199 RepID=A0A7I9VQC2_9BACT|nr:ROK family protein [Anaeromyxobacter diazotrophicus]GEJ58613.1 glucokinase [Anaeromyxobacter diazotrophicus]
MAARALGVDLGGTNARAAVVDRDSGEIVASHKEPHRDRSPAAVVETVAHAVAAALEGAGDAARTFGRVGVGVAGQCLGRTGVVLNAPNLGWRDVPLGELLEERLGAKVRIANDLSAAAWGERRFGAARGVDDAVLVFVGSGVGSGLILGGRLHDGHRGVAGELGHVKVRPSRASTAPRRCGCGELGCLEAYTSGMNLAARVREELAAGASSRLGALLQGDLSRLSASVIDEACVQGDPYACALWEEVADLLGNAIASVVTLLNPARVILGGGVLLGCPDLRRRVDEVFQARVSRSALVGLTLERAFLGDDAGVIGAALLE